MQHPVVFDVWSHTHDPFSNSFKNLSVKVLINPLALRHKLFVNDSPAIKKANQHAFDL